MLTLILLKGKYVSTGEFKKRFREMSFQLFVCEGIDR